MWVYQTLSNIFIIIFSEVMINILAIFVADDVIDFTHYLSSLCSAAGLDRNWKAIGKLTALSSFKYRIQTICGLF